MSTKTTVQDDEERFLGEIESLRMTPEELEALVGDAPVFSYEKWRQLAPPATPEELADTDEFLQDLERDRRRSLALDYAEPKA